MVLTAQKTARIGLGDLCAVMLTAQDIARVGLAV